MKSMTLILGILLALTSFPIFSACGGEDDLGAQSREMADRLTEALDFDSGEISDKELPDWQSSADAPQILEYETPSALQFEQDFSITLRSTYLKYEDVETVVIYVANATNYITVSEILEPTDSDGLYEMRLTGRLKEDDKLDGEEFSVHVALQTSDDVTGEYIIWKFTVGDNGGLDAATQALISNACNNMEEYCSGGDYIWSRYGVDDADLCNSVYSCAYEFYLDDSNCVGSLESGYECLGALKSSDECSHCDDILQTLPNECAFPADCFE